MGPKARQDLIHLKIRKDLHVKQLDQPDPDNEESNEEMQGGRQKGKRLSETRTRRTVPRAKGLSRMTITVPHPASL